MTSVQPAWGHQSMLEHERERTLQDETDRLPGTSGYVKKEILIR